MPSDLHRYDGVERRFCDGDRNPWQRERGLVLVGELLGSPALRVARGLRYDLRYFSGGIGAIDRHHVALPCGAAEVDAVVARLDVATPDEAAADAAWRDEFEWLIGGDDDEPPPPLRDRVVAFIAEERNEFQPAPDAHARVWFSRGSGINAWCLLYEQAGWLCLIAYEQG